MPAATYLLAALQHELLAQTRPPRVQPVTLPPDLLALFLRPRHVAGLAAHALALEFLRDARARVGALVRRQLLVVAHAALLVG